jgi:hypothetical protein
VSLEDDYVLHLNDDVCDRFKEIYLVAKNSETFRNVSEYFKQSVAPMMS